MPNYHIKTRRDTAANWASNNPTPAAGELCLETDTGKKKFGDGVTSYNSLSYDLPAEATTSAAGLMSAADKTKLDGITLSNYAPLASPTFTGTPKAPVVTAYSTTSQIATNGFVETQIASFTTGLMVRCVFTTSAAGQQTVVNSTASVLFMAVNGRAVSIATSQNLKAGRNYVDILFTSSRDIPGTDIPASAFAGLSHLTSIILPERLLRIEDGAFQNCADLDTAYCLGATPPALGTDVFSGTILAGGGYAYIHKAFNDAYTAAWTFGCIFGIIS